MQPNVFTKFSLVRPGSDVGAPRQIEYPVAPNQTIREYDIVSFNGSSQVQQSIALPGANNTGTASGGNLPILGIARNSIITDANGVEVLGGQTRSTLSVEVFDDSLELLLRIYNAVPANAEPQDLVLGTAYQFQRWRGNSASEWWYSLITTTTNGEFELQERYGGSKPDDDYGAMYVKAVQGVRQLG